MIYYITTKKEVRIVYINRIELKRRAKQLVRTGTPNPMVVALIFILATTWLSTVLDLVVENPLNKAMGIIEEWSLAMNLEENVAPSMMDAMSQQLMSCFHGSKAVIGLLVAVLMALYSLVVNFGYYSHTLQKIRGEETSVGEIFSWFGMAGKIILLQILKTLYIYLWSMLFVIPGVIAMYRYRMADYCLLDDPNISALEAIRRSKKLMQGRKMDLFTMDVSFFGWLLLETIVAQFAASLVGMLVAPMMGSLTVPLGITMIVSLIVTTAFSVYLVPYMQYTYAGYYVALKEMPKAPPVNPGAPQPPFVNPPDGFNQNPWGSNASETKEDDSNNEGWNQ